MVKISVRSNFVPTNRKVESISLDEDTASLKSGLEALEAAMKVKLVNDALGDIRRDIVVTVNGVDSNFLTEKLATKLNEGDVLGISFIPLGGG